jgi:cysteine desulfurase / selenocysteine lyase
MIDIKTIKKDFPIFHNNPNLTYLDSTATSLKPLSVIEKLREYYEIYTSNIHRGLYRSAEKATEEYEQTRVDSAKFINAGRWEEIIFTRNTTEALNLLATSLGQDIINEGDEIVISVMEHHSNFVPWQQLALKKKAKFTVIDIDDEGYLKIFNKNEQKVNIELLKQYISFSTKILTLVYVSNTVGTINPITEIIKAAKEINPNIITIVDAAQAAPHMKIDVQAIGCDFLAFSSHKMLGPTGVGVLWGKYDLLQKLSPYQYGGEMISEVSIEQTTFKDTPYKFEAGTPNIADVIAFKEAMRYLENMGLDSIRAHEKELTIYALERMEKEFGETIRIIGPKDANYRGGIITFDLKGAHPHDMAQVLDEDELCIRAGSHCTMPLHRRLRLIGTARASFYMYNDESDVEKLITSLKKVQNIFKK